MGYSRHLNRSNPTTVRRNIMNEITDYQLYSGAVFVFAILAIILCLLWTVAITIGEDD